VDRPQPHVVINEFMAQNTQTIQDNDAEWADWIELFNEGSTTLNLAGFAMTDDFTNLRKWTFPDTSIAAGGFLLIWCDEDEGDPGVHANFKLSASGEQIALCDLENYGGSVLDSLSFRTQSADVSYARLCDGGPTWDFDATPTPYVSNGVCIPSGLVISSADSDLNFRWNSSPGAQEYRVYRLVNLNDPLESGTIIATVADTFATVSQETDALSKAFYIVTAVRP
jgi:hypothetical protein